MIAVYKYIINHSSKAIEIPFQMGVEFVGTGFMDDGLVLRLFESVGL